MAFQKKHVKQDLKRYHGQYRHVNKALALLALNTSDSRKEYKAMGVHKYRRGRINTAAFFEPKGKHPVRCKEKRK